MKKVITAILAFVVVALMAFGYWDAMKHREHIGEKPFDPKETIFEHLGIRYDARQCDSIAGSDEKAMFSPRTYL